MINTGVTIEYLTFKILFSYCFRSTEGIEVSVSVDRKTWNVIATGSLTDPAGSTSCEQVLVEPFPAQSYLEASFVRVKLINDYHGLSSGLNYITWNMFPSYVREASRTYIA